MRDREDVVKYLLLGVFVTIFLCISTLIFKLVPGFSSLFEYSGLSYAIFLAITIFGLPYEFGAIVSLIAGIIFADVWYYTIAQYISLVILFQVGSMLLFSSLGIIGMTLGKFIDMWEQKIKKSKVNNKINENKNIVTETEYMNKEKFDENLIDDSVRSEMNTESQNVLKQFYEKYISFNGRTPRLKYFLYSIVLKLATCAINAIYIFCVTTLHFNSSVSLLLVLPFSLVILAMELTNFIRRLHDLNIDTKNGLILFGVILVCTFIDHILLYIFITVFVLMLLFVKGTNGENKFGDDPLK